MSLPFYFNNLLQLSYLLPSPTILYSLHSPKERMLIRMSVVLLFFSGKNLPPPDPCVTLYAMLEKYLSWGNSIFSGHHFQLVYSCTLHTQPHLHPSTFTCITQLPTAQLHFHTHRHPVWWFLVCLGGKLAAWLVVWRVVSLTVGMRVGFSCVILIVWLWCWEFIGSKYLCV